jgi:hypothetical protein
MIYLTDAEKKRAIGNAYEALSPSDKIAYDNLSQAEKYVRNEATLENVTHSDKKMLDQQINNANANWAAVEPTKVATTGVNHNTVQVDNTKTNRDPKIRGSSYLNSSTGPLVKYVVAVEKINSNGTFRTTGPQIGVYETTSEATLIQQLTKASWRILTAVMLDSVNNTPILTNGDPTIILPTVSLP